MHQTFENFRRHLQKHYFPQSPALTDSLTPNLISPFVVRLPHAIREEAQKIAADLHRISLSPTYRARVQKEVSLNLENVQQTPSLFNSLDVHIDENGRLKIIEINTNASAFLINLENYIQRGINTFPNAAQDLVSSFQKTYGDRLKPGNLFLVLDENPTQQNLYIEFLMFQIFFKTQFGVDCEIAAPQELSLSADRGLIWKNRKVAGIYNRFTDFYFSTNTALASAYEVEETLISPNPLEYALLADKKRFQTWTPELFEELRREENLEVPHLQAALLESRRFGDFASPDEIWSQRARYFFKPPNSYGGKSVYRGKSISRTVFQRIYDESYIAQQFVAAPELTQSFEGREHTFKYDLRFYFFQGQIQLTSARLYQGQLTNLKTPLGGLTSVEFTP